MLRWSLAFPCERHVTPYIGGSEVATVTSYPPRVQHSHQLHVVKALQVFQLQCVTRRALIGYLKAKNSGFYCISQVTWAWSFWWLGGCWKCCSWGTHCLSWLCHHMQVCWISPSSFVYCKQQIRLFTCGWGWNGSSEVPSTCSSFYRGGWRSWGPTW